MKITNYFLSSSLHLFLIITISILFNNSNVLLASDLTTKQIIIPGETAEVNKPFKPKFEICNINIFDALANEWHVVVKIMDKNEIVVFNETVSGVFLAKGSSSNPSCVTRETSSTFTPSTTGTHTISVDVNYSEDINTGNDEMNKQFSVVEAPSYSISGNILEEVNYGGNLGSYIGTPRPNVIMELYGSGGSLIFIIATADNGSYSFADLTSGNYTVRATNYSVTSSRPKNGGAEGNPIPVQTYRTDASTGSPVDVNHKVGGEEPSKVDADLNNGGQHLSALTTSLTTPQSITLVKLTDHDISGINFVFNFSTIVNTNSEDQGSLRQFIINSNLLSNNGLAQSGKTAGIESSIFMIPSSSDPLSRPADPNFDGKVFKISPTSEYPPFVDKVKLDGFIQTALTGNTNPERPEILLDGSSAGETSNGVSFLIADCRLTGMTIQNFGGNGIFCNSKIYLGTVNQSEKSVECLNNGFHGIQSKSADYVGDAFLALENNGGDGIRIETDLDVDGIITQKNGGWGVHFGNVFRIRRVVGQRAYFWENGLGGISGINGLLSGSYFDCHNNGYSASGDNTNEGHGIIVKDAFLTGVSSTENKKDGINAGTIRHREINGLEKLTVMNNGGYGIKVKGTMTADGIFVQDNGEWGIFSESGNVYVLKDSKNIRNYIWRNAKGGISVKSGTFKGKFMDFYKNGYGSSSDDEGYGLIAKSIIVNGIDVSESKNDGIRSESITHTRISGQENLLSIRNGGDGLNVKGNIKADGIFVNRNMGWGAFSEKGSIIIKLKKSRNYASYNKLGGLSAANGSVQCSWLFNSNNGEMSQNLSEGHGIIAGRVTIQEFGNGSNKGDGIRAHIVNVTNGFGITDNEGYGIIGSIVKVRGIFIARNKKGGIKLLRNIKRSEVLAKLNSVNEDNETNTVEIKNSTISDNEGYGIDVGYFKNLFIEKNNIMRNTGFDLFSNVGTLEANNNWWGENSSPSMINDFISVDNWLADSISLSIFTESESYLTTSGNVDSLLFSVNNSSNLNDSLSIVVTDSLGWVDEFTYNSVINDSIGVNGVINFTVPNSNEQQNKISITATSLISGIEVSKTILVTSYIPVYSSLRILEDSLTVSFGDTINFTAVKIDQNKNEVLSQPSWNSSSGLVDNSGKFISDSAARVVELIAEDIESGLSQNTHVYITNEEILLKEIQLSPSIVTILPGDVFEFTMSGKNQFGFPMEYPVTWDATGGTIDVNGLFIAGENSGNYEVTVSDSTGTIVSTAIINILVGVESIEEKLPQNISLAQNYPNPFNPRTTINFSIPKESFVNLKVYNVLGKEIESLVSESKTPGNYNIDFGSDQLSSGIYFYKLEVGDFIETKKMIFLK